MQPYLSSDWTEFKKSFLCLPSVQAGTLLIAGMGMFCGSLYHQALTGDPGLRKVAPMGGMAMIVGWLAIVLWTVTVHSSSTGHRRDTTLSDC